MSELDLKIPVVDTMKWIAKIANKSYLSERTKRKALIIITSKEMFVGKNPI